MNDKTDSGSDNEHSELQEWQMPKGLEPWREYVHLRYRGVAYYRIYATVEDCLLRKLLEHRLLLTPGEKRDHDDLQGLYDTLGAMNKAQDNTLTRLRAENERLKGILNELAGAEALGAED